MTDSDTQGKLQFDRHLLNLLAEFDHATSMTYLTGLLSRAQMPFEEAAAALASVTLQQAEQAPQQATQWLRLAQALHEEAPIAENQAQIAYAQARLYLQEGQLSAAQESLHQAQTTWQTLGNSAAVARTFLGLTQILTLQGKLSTGSSCY